MEKVRRYSCDGGCITIGNASFIMHIPNDFGDGRHRVIVSDDQSRPKRAKWVGAVKGDAINVYGYDCLHSFKDLCENVLLTLRGEYDVWVRCGTVLFIKRGGTV